MSAAERAIEASSADQASEWAVQASECLSERMSQYSRRRFHRRSTQRTMILQTILYSSTWFFMQKDVNQGRGSGVSTKS